MQRCLTTFLLGKTFSHMLEFPWCNNCFQCDKPWAICAYSTGCFDVELITVTTTGCNDILLEDAICAGSPPIGVGMADTLEACLQTGEVCFFYDGLDADTILGFWRWSKYCAPPDTIVQLSQWDWSFHTFLRHFSIIVLIMLVLHCCCQCARTFVCAYRQHRM